MPSIFPATTVPLPDKMVALVVRCIVAGGIFVRVVPSRVNPVELKPAPLSPAMTEPSCDMELALLTVADANVDVVLQPPAKDTAHRTQRQAPAKAA